MSEEEIIKDLTKYISFANKSENFSNDNDFKWNTELSQRVQGLLDLYQKEKEKNKLLIEGKFREVADKNSYIKDNYISKDKIRERKEKLEKENEEHPDCFRQVLILEYENLLEEK